MWSAARSAKISMILCMPERVSGGDAKFQGFCDGWNKWEGQVRSRSQAVLNIRLMQEVIPEDFWRELVHEKLLDAAAPIPKIESAART